MNTATIECNIHGGPITGDYFVIDEGGSIPKQYICIQDCIDLLSEDQLVWAVDNAVMAEGHDCLRYAEIRGSENIWECAVCGLVLEQSGDALVVPAV